MARKTWTKILFSSLGVNLSIQRGGYRPSPWDLLGHAQRRGGPAADAGPGGGAGAAGGSGTAAAEKAGHAAGQRRGGSLL